MTQDRLRPPKLTTLPSVRPRLTDGTKKVAQVNNAAFAAATVGAKLRPWSREVCLHLFAYRSSNC